jgi:hypothetical protein
MSDQHDEAHSSAEVEATIRAFTDLTEEELAELSDEEPAKGIAGGERLVRLLGQNLERRVGRNGG